MNLLRCQILFSEFFDLFRLNLKIVSEFVDHHPVLFGKGLCLRRKNLGIQRMMAITFEFFAIFDFVQR